MTVPAVPQLASRPALRLSKAAKRQARAEARVTLKRERRHERRQHKQEAASRAAAERMAHLQAMSPEGRAAFELAEEVRRRADVLAWEEQEARASDMLQKEVSMAKRLRDDAKRALQHAKRNALLKGLPTDGPSIVRMSVRVSKAEKRLKKAEQRWLEDERLRDPHRIGEDRKGKRTLMQAVRRMKLMLRATANKASSPKKGSPTRAGGGKAMGANAFGGPGTPAPSKSLQDASLMSPPLASLLESAGKGKPADGEVDSLASGRGHGDHNDDVEA